MNPKENDKLERQNIINKYRMSNKSLFITVIVIIILIVAGVLIYSASQRNTIGTGADQYSNPAPVSTDTPTNDNPATSTPSSASSTPQASAACTRNFNQSTLTNSKVDIQNKFVTINVKDFGTIKVQLYDKDAPKAVENFLRLTNSGYYNCLTFHRIAKGFVIQGGDPSGNGTGGQSAFGAPFADELNPSTDSYKAGYVKGVLAMANSGPNTNGSQFFIMLADNQLSHDYTIFGKVVSGQDVVDKIGQVDIIPQMGPTDGKPATPVVMETLTISDK